MKYEIFFRKVLPILFTLISSKQRPEYHSFKYTKAHHGILKSNLRQNDVIPEVRDAAAVAFNEISANDLNLTSQEDTAESDDGEAYSDIRL